MQPGEAFVPFRIFTGIFLPECLAAYKGLPPAAKIVWARLAQYAGDRGTAFPGQERLARACGLSRSGTQLALATLRDAGFISQRGLFHRNVVWEFLWHPCFNACVRAHNLSTTTSANAQNVGTTELSPESRQDHAQKVGCNGLDSGHDVSPHIHVQPHEVQHEGEQSPSGDSPPPTPDPVCTWCKRPQRRETAIQRLLGYYHDGFLKAVGRCPVAFAPSGGKTLSELLKETDEQSIRTAIGNLFNSTDSYIVGHNYPITKLRSDFNALVDHPLLERRLREGRAPRGVRI